MSVCECTLCVAARSFYKHTRSIIGEAAAQQVLYSLAAVATFLILYIPAVVRLFRRDLECRRVHKPCGGGTRACKNDSSLNCVVKGGGEGEGYHPPFTYVPFVVHNSHARYWFTLLFLLIGSLIYYFDLPMLSYVKVCDCSFLYKTL